MNIEQTELIAICGIYAIVVVRIHSSCKSLKKELLEINKINII